MTHRLNDADALNCGAQLAGAIDQLQERHGWTHGDAVAVIMAAMTEALGRRLGPSKTIDLLTDHAAELAKHHAERSRI